MSSKTTSYDPSGSRSRPPRCRLLAAVCLAATLTCVPVAAGGQSGDGPGQLWQEFPLEQKQVPPPRGQPQAPPPATTPAPSTSPAPTTTPVEPEPAPAETEDRASVSEAGESNQQTPAENKRADGKTRVKERSGKTAMQQKEGKGAKTRTELYAEARRRDLPGRSTMSKAQLEKALG